MSSELVIVLSPEDRGTAWRNDLRPGEARLGWEHLGPQGLARRLGTLLGLPTATAAAPDRIGAYRARLAACDGEQRSYSRSFASDATGVARYLLGLRDELVLAGWDARPLTGSRRLRDLDDVERAGPPVPHGLPDVLLTIARVLERGATLPATVEIRLAAEVDAFSPLLRRVLAAVSRGGAKVVASSAPSAAARAGSDLLAVQRALLGDAPGASLAGDGSFVLLEADTPLEAGELVASLLHDQPLDATTAYVPTDAEALDAALARHGLPTLGLAGASRWRAVLQVLPLRLSLAFEPQDPSAAAELLSLPGAPLQRRVRQALLEALHEMPGVGSSAWNATVARLVEATRDERGADEAEALRAQIVGWFGGPLYSRGAGIPPARAAELCARVAAWARARAATSSDDGELHAHAAEVARTLERLLVTQAAGSPLTPLALEQLHDVAVGDGTDGGLFAAQSGRAACCTSVAQPLAACDALLWWGFLASTDDVPRGAAWTAGEARALAALGVELPGLGVTRRNELAGWLRAVLAPRRRLVLVRWQLAGTEQTFAHPLHDQLEILLGRESLDRCTLTARAALGGRGLGAADLRLSSSVVELPAATLLEPREVWRLPAAAVAPTGHVSASALQHLFGCPFRWVLEHRADLRPGRAASLPRGNQLLGSFAHAVLESMFFGDDRLDLSTATEDDAERWAHAAFDRRVGLEAAPLVQSGNEVERHRARALVGAAARGLLGVVRGAALTPVAFEQELDGSFAGHPLRGRIDLAFERGGRPVIVDLKLGKGAERREDLARGRALQLAIYSSHEGAGTPATAYFILEDHELLTTDPTLPGATLVDGPGMPETLASAQRGFELWKNVLAAGVVPRIPAKDGEWKAAVERAGGSIPTDGPAAPAPSCRYCDYEVLCRATQAVGGAR